MSVPKKIGSFEAKTRLAELLREVERGQSYDILRRGKPVARLGPVPDENSGDLRAIAAAFRQIRARARGSVPVRDLIDTGRKR
ncbi:MAG: type II toxin-antitoxin system prevent-host-death family antitoxin [Deltaproteobacteria bacterium]|nr:type II toxin-antitoxin system prevent-host-death family antitoxin [Deltaproteobacteria bacterium]